MKTTTALAWLALLLSSPLSADEIHLVDGTVYVAEKWWVEGDYIVMETPRGLVKVLRATVRSIVSDKIETTATERTQQRQSGVFRVPYGEPTAAEKLFAVPDEILPLLERGNYAAALSAVNAAGGSYAESADCRILKGTLLMRAGRFNEARDSLTAALDLGSTNPYALYFLGRTAYLQGRWSDALELFRAAAEAGAVAVAGARLEDNILSLEAAAEMPFRASEHFFVRTLASGVSEIDLEDVAALLEAKYTQVAVALAHDAPEPILVVLSDAGSDMALGRERQGAFDGKIEISADLIGSRALEETLTHELVHALLLTATRGNCPEWLHEGLAQLLSGRGSGMFAAEIGQWARGVRGRLDLYPDSLSLTEYLIGRFDFQRILNLVAALGRGINAEDAVPQTFGEPLEHWRQLRDRWLRATYGSPG